MGGPFSLRCLSPLCSPAGGAGQTQSMRVELLQCNLAGFAAQKNRLVFSLRYSISALLGMLRRGLDIPVTQKASGILYPRWSLLRAMRPVAEWRPFLFNKQGNHTRPASREARRRAAVKPRPNRISLYAPARPWRAVRGWVQGVTPCYTVRVSCSPRRAAFSARRGRMKVERNSSTCWALRPV